MAALMFYSRHAVDALQVHGKASCDRSILVGCGISAQGRQQLRLCRLPDFRCRQWGQSAVHRGKLYGQSQKKPRRGGAKLILTTRIRVFVRYQAHVVVT